jgi:hypothetical protein
MPIYLQTTKLKSRIMKKLVFPPVIAAAIIALSFSACSKNEDSPSLTDAQLNEQGFDKAKAFFQNNAPAYQSFSVDASAGGIITTSKGTKLTFPANAFKNANGQTVSGNVTVEVKDIMDASDMLLGNRPTEANGNMLISFGEMTVKASQNGQALQLRNDSTITRVQVPLAPNPAAGQGARDFPIWDGDSLATFSINGHDHENAATTLTQSGYISRGINWTPTANIGISNGNGTSTFRLDSLGQWRNCDALAGDPRPKTTVLGYFTNQYNGSGSSTFMGAEPSMLFFKVKQQNTLIKLYNKIYNAPADKQGMLSYQNSFAIGLEGTFLAFTFKGGKVYAEMKDVVIGAPAAGKTYYPFAFNLTETTEAGLLSLIQQIKTK